MDRRTIKTKQSIYTAFSSLLAKKNYNKITIQDIIDEANIGRSTFYAHFETKDELLNQMCFEMFEHIYSTIKTEKMYDILKKNNDPVVMISHILFHIEKVSGNLSNLLLCESNEIFFKYFEDYFEEFANQYLIDTISPYVPNLPQDFLIHHISGSFINTLKWWIKNKFKQTPDEVAKYFSTVIFLKARN